MCLLKSSESCRVDGGVAQLIGQSVEGHRASDSECPTAVRAEPMSRNHQPVTSGWCTVTVCASVDFCRDAGAAGAVFVRQSERDGWTVTDCGASTRLDGRTVRRDSAAGNVRAVYTCAADG